MTLACILQMDMGVLEAGQNQAATGINNPSGFAGKCPDLGCRSQCHDPAVTRSEARNFGHQRIHGPDIAVDENEIRRHSCSYSSRAGKPGARKSVLSASSRSLTIMVDCAAPP